MLRITSPNFQDGSSIPLRFTCDGVNYNPELNISEVPEGTQSIALIMDDPDAPMGLWVHWIIWNIKPDTSVIVENAPPIDAVYGKNSSNENKYMGPCPPDREHRYFFKIYALDDELDLPDNSNKEDLERAMEGHILEEAQLMGTYKRQQ